MNNSNSHILVQQARCMHVGTYTYTQTTGTYIHNTCISSIDTLVRTNTTHNVFQALMPIHKTYTQNTYLSIHICTEVLVFECVNTHLVAGWTMASVVHIEAVILTIMAKVNVTVFATP